MNRVIPAILATLIAILLLSSTIFVVDQRKFAIVFSFGEIKDVIREPGLHFKLPPPFQNILYLDKRILTIESPEADRFITKEKLNILVDSFVKWRITDPKQYYISVGADEMRAQDRMNQIVKAALNESITRRSTYEVVSGGREAVMKELRDRVAEEATKIGIEIVDVRLKRVDLPPEISESVYRRMEAERKRAASKARSTGAAESEKLRADAERQRDVIIAEAYRDAQKVKGEGDARASLIYSDAFGQNPEFYQFYRSLDAYRASFKNRTDVLVIDPSSEFFKYMKNPGVAGSSGSGKAAVAVKK